MGRIRRMALAAVGVLALIVAVVTYRDVARANAVRVLVQRDAACAAGRQCLKGHGHAAVSQ